MTIDTSAVEGLHNAQSLLEYAANRLSTRTGIHGSVYDVVSLGDAAVSLVEGKIAMTLNAGAFHAADQMRKTQLDLVG